MRATSDRATRDRWGLFGATVWKFQRSQHGKPAVALTAADPGQRPGPSSQAATQRMRRFVCLEPEWQQVPGTSSWYARACMVRWQTLTEGWQPHTSAQGSLFTAIKNVFYMRLGVGGSAPSLHCIIFFARPYGINTVFQLSGRGVRGCTHHSHAGRAGRIHTKTRVLSVLLQEGRGTAARRRMAFLSKCRASPTDK